MSICFPRCLNLPPLHYPRLWAMLAMGPVSLSPSEFSQARLTSASQLSSNNQFVSKKNRFCLPLCLLGLWKRVIIADWSDLYLTECSTVTLGNKSNQEEELINLSRRSRMHVEGLFPFSQARYTKSQHNQDPAKQTRP